MQVGLEIIIPKNHNRNDNWLVIAFDILRLNK